MQTFSLSTQTLKHNIASTSHLCIWFVFCVFDYWSINLSIYLYLSLFFSIYSSKTPAQQCLYQYSREPPSELNCNPYESNQLRLECRLLVNTSQSPELRVRWFFVATGTDRAMEVAATSPFMFRIRVNTETIFINQITVSQCLAS